MLDRRHEALDIRSISIHRPVHGPAAAYTGGGRPANGEEQLLPPLELDPPSYARAELPAVSVDGAGVSPH